ncbi:MULTISPECIES: effector-associated domain 2-containing protein [Frankia]|uniref:effector-associated domain 2-containing protein n=1 Tax=Frankia TaxID=1854 RepID=UPI0005D11952|nr:MULTISPECIES: effector-associated domain EAD1-containing protein [Frankia]KQC35433.1 hypothetical protein UK82_26500 [Frankia sp. ACN1ag]
MQPESRGDAAAYDAVLTDLVDVLDGEPGFGRESARRLLQDRIAHHLGPGHRLHLVEHDVRYQWFAALVYRLGEESGGLAALGRAVNDLQPDSRVAAVVARLVAAADEGVGERWAEDHGAAMPRVTASPPADPPSGRAAAEVDGPPQPLRPVEIRELASAFGQGGGARRFLVDAGVPAERIPPSDIDAATFWAEVSALLGHGLLRDGRRRVLAAAAFRFPANDVFAAGRPR